MQEQGQPQNVVQPQDPQYELEQHIIFRRKQQISTANMSKTLEQGVCNFSKIMDGTTYAYTRLKLRNLGLYQITDAIEKYPHLQNIDLSQNSIKQIPTILQLRFLTQINLSRNCITNITFLSRESVFPYLKSINMLGNKIDTLPTILSKNLKKLNLNYNCINNVQQFNGHPQIQIIELRGNKIKSLKGINNTPNLKQIYLAENQINSLSGLQNLPQLWKIHARKNKISSLSDFPKLPKVRYLNLRQNPVAKVDDLKGAQQTIESLNLLGTPLEGQLADNVKKQVWMLFRHYTRINKSDVLPEQREQFDAEYKQILATRQRQRLEKQAAEKQAAEKQQQQDS